LSAVARTAGVAIMPIEIVNNLPLLSVSVADQNIPVTFDLGGNEPIGLTTRALERIKVEILPDAYTLDYPVLEECWEARIAQQMAAHELPRTTPLYDRRDHEVVVDELERILI
jgi:hypothetical protein